MQVEGTMTIDAPREVVWAFLTDPHAVSQCVPGVSSLEVIVPDQKFRALASVGFGSVRVNFNTTVEWVKLDPPRMAEMKAHGDAPGSAADVVSEMVLSESPTGGTEMHWSADVVIAGTIASLASRLMGTVTKKLANQFFDCLKAHIET